MMESVCHIPELGSVWSKGHFFLYLIYFIQRYIRACPAKASLRLLATWQLLNKVRRNTFFFFCADCLCEIHSIRSAGTRAGVAVAVTRRPRHQVCLVFLVVRVCRDCVELALSCRRKSSRMFGQDQRGLLHCIWLFRRRNTFPPCMMYFSGCHLEGNSTVPERRSARVDLELFALCLALAGVDLVAVCPAGCVAHRRLPWRGRRR